MRAVGENDLGRLVVELLALGRRGHGTRLDQDVLELRVAVLAPVDEAVASEPDRDVGVRIGTPAPDSEGSLVVALDVALGDRGRLQHLDLDLDAGLGGHRLHHLGELLLGRGVGRVEREADLLGAGGREQRPGLGDVALRHRQGCVVPGAARGPGLVGGDELAVVDDLVDDLAVERQLERLAHARVLAQGLGALAVGEIDRHRVVGGRRRAHDLGARVRFERGDVGRQHALDDLERT